MLTLSQKSFIRYFASLLPDRKPGRRGTKPIDKNLLLEQLFIKFRLNLGWRDIKHPSTCRAYFKELQRRSIIIKKFHQLVKEQKSTRPRKTIIDSSDMESYQTNGLVKYSGKYHNYCIKMTVEITPGYVPIAFDLSKGSESDSGILSKILLNRHKLPYELYLDKGYEKYDRRRDLKRQNCQVRMEMKKCDNSRKRGPRFCFTEEHKKQRGEIEKFFGWLKAFRAIRYNRLRLKSLIMGMFIFCLSYLAFIHL